MEKLNDLILLLEELELFLITHGDDGYGTIIKEIKQNLSEGYKLNDDCLINNTLNELKHYAFGGMGSLTDLVISRKNGHIVNDEISTNKKYWELLLVLQKKLKNVMEKRI